MAMVSVERAHWTRIITNNLGLKLLALALSVMLFSLVHSDVDAQRSMFIDVVALLPAPSADRMLVSELPTQVKVTLRGSRSRLSDLSRDDFSPIQLDLREGASGNYYFRPSDVDVDGGLHVIAIEPASVPLSWAPTGRKQVTVHAKVEGKLNEHARLRGLVTARPAEVTVRGPKTALADISTVSTDVISLTDLQPGRHTRRVALAPLPKLVTYEGDAFVEVQIDIDPVVSERVLRRLEVAVLGASSAALRPDRVAVTLRGPQDVLSELEPEQVVPYIELQEGVANSWLAHDVKLRGVPDSLEIVRVIPANVLARPVAAKGTP
jgi:YbbR domain-containing protein